MKINRERNRRDALDSFRWQDPAEGWEKTVFLKARRAESRAGNQPQDMILWKGLQLIGAGSRCLKGLFYEVEDVNETVVRLTSGLELTHEQATQSLRLCYAITYASCQGLTLPGVVRLDTQSSHFTLKHLYVGLSRATAAGLVEVN